MATITVLADMNTAPSAGVSRMPQAVPAMASGMATMFLAADHDIAAAEVFPHTAGQPGGQCC